MAYKRNIDRLPIIPADAKEHNVVCHYCIVGCGYKAYTWDVNKQGGTAPDQNKFGVDLGQQQPAETAAWYSPSMYNIVQPERPRRAPRHQARQGLRRELGPRLDPRRPHGRDELLGGALTQLQRLTDPMVWRYGQMQPTSWDDALDLVAARHRRGDQGAGRGRAVRLGLRPWRRRRRLREHLGHRQALLRAMKVKNIRIHNRPAYNSEVHATRDMGVGELNNCYEDAELADTIVAVGTNALETQTNYFLNHWVPNLRGTSLEKKQAELPDEPHEPARSSSSTRAAP